MASNLVRTDYTDFELIDYNPSNSVIVQRVKSLKPPYKNLICKGLSSFDEAENRKLKAEFEILNYIHTNLKDYTDYKKSPQIHVVSDPKIDMLVANATIAKLDAQSSSSGSGGAADGLSDNAAGTTGVVNSDIVDSNGGSVNIAPFDDMAPSLKARRPSAANVRKLQNFLNGEISGDPALRIVCPVELTMHNDIAVVFLEDIGGLSMRQYIKELKYGHDGSAYSSDMSLSGASSGGVGSGNPVEKRLLFEDFLIIALQMAEALDIIHSMGITHRDICPENIIIKKFAENIVVQLIDFNAAQIGTTETYVAASSDVIQGNLPYMSPEQTGRTEQSVDYRTDFYSMGITLWELLVGRKPFDFDYADVAEYVHSHLAVNLVPPSEIDPDIPELFSQIIAKLAHKSPDMRYQSASGLRSDLQACIKRVESLRSSRSDLDLSNLDNTTVIFSLNTFDYKIGCKDLPDKLKYPMAVGWRDAEKQRLIDIFQKLHVGVSKKEICVITGAFGQGRSSLASQLQSHVTSNHGVFVSGKYDVNSKHKPYHGILEGLEGFINHVLSVSNEEFESWHVHLCETVGEENLTIVTELLPDLKMITDIGVDYGNRNILEEEDESSGKNDFIEAFVSFFSAIARPQHPLVMFLDDIETADQPSLNLLKAVLSDNRVQNLFLVVSANETFSMDNCGFSQIFNTLKVKPTANTCYTMIELESLKASDIFKFLQELLSPMIQTSEELHALATVVHSKTLGNAYHIKEVMMNAERRGFLYLDKVRGGWTWELNNIESNISIAENVVDFMLAKMQSFPPDTFILLKYAACIGNRFDLRCLSYIADMNLNTVANHLWLAVKEGILSPSSEGRLAKQPARLSRSSSNTLSPPLLSSQPKITGSKNLEKLGERIAAKAGLTVQYTELMFSHDKLQLASYKFLMDSERKQTHIKIARILRKNFVDEETDELDVVRHLNEAMDLVTDPEERHYSIKLNYQAGVRAKRSKASAIAKQFFIKALNFFRIGEAEGSNLIPLSDDAKETVVKNMIALIQMHSSDFENEAAESLCSEALKLTKSLDDRLQITDMLLPLLSYKLEFNEVLDMAIQSLAAHGMTIPRQEPELGIAYALEREKFEDNMKKPDLLQLVLPNSEKVLSSIGKYIYDALSAADHLGLSDLSNYLAVKGCNNILDSGNREKSAELFSWVTKIYFDIPDGHFPDLDRLRWFSDLTSKLIEHSPIDSQVSALTHLWNCGQAYVLAQNRQLEPAVRKCVARSKESESRVSLRMLFILFANQIHQGHPSAIIRETTKIPTKIFDRISTQHSILQESWNRCIGCFDTLCNGDSVNELSLPSAFVPSVPLNSVRETLMYLIMVMYETTNADAATDYMWSNLRYHKPVIRYMSIAFQITRMLAMRYSKSKDETERVALMIKIDDQIAWLKHLASEPSNDHHCKYLLALAEKSRISQKPWEALKNYEAGIEHARKSGLSLWEAFGTELYAKFFVEQNNRRLAKNCMATAYHLWKSWGSDGKARQLFNKYNDLFTDQTIQLPASMVVKQAWNKNMNLTGSGNLRTSITKVNSTAGTNLDVSTMLKVAQSITNESNLEELLAKVIKYVMMNAGAKKGVLVLNDSGKLCIQAYADSVDGLEQTRVLKEGIPIEKLASSKEVQVPLSIILFVFRSREHVVLNDASSDHLYSADPYIRSNLPRSLLCIPIVHQNTVSGVMYLENDTQNGVFTSDRVELIKSLMASISISMENAKLTKKNTELANALKQTQEQDGSTANSGPRYNIDAPIKKTIDVLYQMKASLPPNDPNVRQIEFVMRTLTSADLFASSIDEINDEQGRGIDQDTKNWIENSLLQKSSRKPVLNRENSKDSIMTTIAAIGRTASIEESFDANNRSQNIALRTVADFSSSLNSKDIENQLELAATADFDVFKFAEVTHGRPLYHLGCHYLEKYGLLQHFNIPETKIRKFFETVESSYLKLPYHNSSHAADVLQTVNLLLLSDQKMAEHFSKLDIFAACIASAAHDVDHPGLNNNFLVQSGHKLAIMYNDLSVLEFHHASKAFQIASRSECNIFSGMASDQIRDVRKLVIGMVVATDMAQHFQYINKLKGKIAASSLRLEDPADRSLVLEMAIKCADLNNPTKPTEQCTKWAYSVMQEFFKQGDLERKMGIPVSKFMDRNDTNIPRCQIGFIDILVTPLFDSWSQCIQTDFTRRCMENIARNREYWESLLNNLDAVPKFPEPSDDLERGVSIDFDTTFSFGRKAPSSSSSTSSTTSKSSSSQQQQSRQQSSGNKGNNKTNTRNRSSRSGSASGASGRDRRSSGSFKPKFSQASSYGPSSTAMGGIGGATSSSLKPRSSSKNQSPLNSLPDLPSINKKGTPPQDATMVPTSMNQ